jgi:hypothetical protein
MLMLAEPMYIQFSCKILSLHAAAAFANGNEVSGVGIDKRGGLRHNGNLLFKIKGSGDYDSIPGFRY